MAVAGAHLVGREDELQALADLLDAPDRLPRTAVLAGEAGIGKTSVWLEALRAAEDRGYRVLTCRPAETEARYSFAALADLVGGVLPEVLPGLPVPQRRALETALALADPGGAAVDEGVVAFAFLTVLRRLADDGPVALAVDDLQWLDAPSLALLRFALARLERAPVATLMTVRGEVPAWLRRAAEERVLVLELGSMSVGAVHELIRTRLGQPLPRPALLRIWETSGGNPFYALELARAVGRRGGRIAPGEELPLPRDLDVLVHERLDALRGRALEVARAVAALADPDVELVRATVGRGADAGLRRALDAKVLELDGERLRFTHPLLASAVAARVAPGDRRRLHARLAAVVRDAEARARHLALAAPRPSAAVAAALDEAGRRARSRGAPLAAADLAEQALSLTPPGDAPAVRRRTLDAADHAYVAGDPARAIALLESALAHAAPGAERAVVKRQIAAVRTRLTGPQEGIAVYREALAETGGDDRLEAEIHLELAYTLRFASGMRDAEPHAAAAVEAAERAGDEELLCKALAVSALIHFNLGRGVDERVMERALALEESAGIGLTFMGAKAALFEQLRWSQDVERARALGEELSKDLHRRGDPVEADALVMLGLTEWRAGDWQAAAERFEAARALEEQSGRIGLSPQADWPRALLAAHRGQLEEAEALAGHGVELAEAAGFGTAAAAHRWVLGFVELSRDDPAAALVHLRASREQRDALGVLEPQNRFELPDLLDALVGAGELEEAEAVLAPWEERARRLDRAWALAIAARCRALVLAARGDLDGALAAFGPALAEHARAGDPFQRARTLLALGTTRRRAKLRGAARQTLGEALATFERLPAPLWAEKARAELGRIGGRGPGGVELTATERRVAALVAEGRPTKEVAAALFVAPKTIEKHLSRIYAKLGVRSRAELAHRLGGGQRGGISPVSPPPDAP